MIVTSTERLTERVQIALTPQEDKRLRDRAKASAISVSELGRQLLLDGLREL